VFTSLHFYFLGDLMPYNYLTISLRSRSSSILIPLNYNLAFPSLLAISLNSLLRIFPLALFGMTSNHTTPPRNCLC
jgi:hypothetical protein